jgi:hypothetical protein
LRSLPDASKEFRFSICGQDYLAETMSYQSPNDFVQPQERRRINSPGSNIVRISLGAVFSMRLNKSLNALLTISAMGCRITERDGETSEA